MIAKKIRSDKESSLVPSFETKLYLRAIYPSAISDSPIIKTRQRNNHSTFHVSNSTNESIIRNNDMIFGIDFFKDITSVFC